MMHRTLIIIIVIFSLSGCIANNDADTVPCYSFAHEPTLWIVQNTTMYKVFHSNGMYGDTSKNHPNSGIVLPFDMNSNQMSYDFYNPNYLGTLVLDYQLKYPECSDRMGIEFSELSVNDASTFRQVFYTDRDSKETTRIDSLDDLNRHVNFRSRFTFK